ncbi:MAG: hypothetical protein AAFQ43_00445 [Bacteroidota bacterium]
MTTLAVPHPDLDDALLCVEDMTQPGSWQRSALRISAMMEHGGDPTMLALEVVRLRGIASLSLLDTGVSPSMIDQAVFPPGVRGLGLTGEREV